VRTGLPTASTKLIEYSRSSLAVSRRICASSFLTLTPAISFSTSRSSLSLRNRRSAMAFDTIGLKAWLPRQSAIARRTGCSSCDCPPSNGDEGRSFIRPSPLRKAGDSSPSESGELTDPRWRRSPILCPPEALRRGGALQSAWANGRMAPGRASCKAGSMDVVLHGGAEPPWWRKSQWQAKGRRKIEWLGAMPGERAEQYEVRLGQGQTYVLV
jgi:hypothetical protein